MNRLSIRFDFPGASGETLAGRLELPIGKPSCFALFAHCFTCSKDVFAAARISRALAEQGVAVLRFDFTGLGNSEGDFANTNFSSNVEDLVAAIHALRDRYEAPKLLIGHSLGGAAVIAVAAQCPQAEAVVTIGAPADPAHVAKQFKDSTAEIDAKGEAVVALAGRSFTIRKQFLEDINAQDQASRIENLGKALLVFHAPEDDIVKVWNGEEIYAKAHYPKSFVALDGADHLLSRRADALYVAGVIGAWVRRTLKLEGPADPSADAKAGAEDIYVTETGEGTFVNLVQAKGHFLLADEPHAMGGEDRGPGPYDLLLAGLGACTSMTLRMYADRKKWPLARVGVRLTHRKEHAEDSAESAEAKRMIDRIERALVLEGDLDSEQRQRLLEIADRCPVHRTLEATPAIVTTLTDPDVEPDAGQ